MFFCTAQVVLNDLKTQRLAPEAVVALVLDECHNATGGERGLRAARNIEPPR